MQAPRFDLYAAIHKALRLAMSQALCRLGSSDPADPLGLTASLDRLQALLTLCELHLKHENQFVHPALERAQPRASAHIADEHDHHRAAIAQLRGQVAGVEQASPAARGAAFHALYRATALFVAENFQHMEFEEREHNALLWAHYSDAELLQIEHAIVASVAPDSMMALLHFFLPALNASERAAMLRGMQQGLPAPVFDAVLDIARRTLEPRAHAQLLQALGRVESAALA
jgi:hypothetical protein